MTEDPIRTLRAQNQQGMGRCAGGMGSEATDRLAALDAQAVSIRGWTQAVIPGLLQTDQYAYATIKAASPALSEYEIASCTRHRADRREAFMRKWRSPGAGQAWFLIGESAIVHPSLAAHAHGAQLKRVLEVIEDCPRITIQILRTEIPTAGDTGPFLLHALQDGLRIGHLETLVGGWYTTTPEDIARMYSAFTTMTARAMEPEESREFIKEEIAACWESTWDSTTEPGSSSPPTPTLSPASTSLALPPGSSR